MEGMRQLDEFRELSAKLPPFEAIVAIPRPLSPKLRDLKPHELDLIQTALDEATVQQIIDHSPQTDLDTAQALLSLLDRGYLTIG